MFMRLLYPGIIVLCGAVGVSGPVAAERLEAEAVGQSVRFRIVIPEVKPLELNDGSASLSARDLELVRDVPKGITRHVVSDRYGRHYVRHAKQFSDGLRLTLASP